MKYILTILLLLTSVVAADEFVGKTFVGKLEHGESFSKHTTKFFKRDGKIVGEYKLKTPDTTGTLEYVRTVDDKEIFLWKDDFGFGFLEIKFDVGTGEMKGIWYNNRISDGKHPWNGFEVEK